jgi:hypothetical protein
VAGPTEYHDENLDMLASLGHELYDAVLALHAFGFCDTASPTVCARARSELAQLLHAIGRARTGSTTGMARSFAHLHRLEDMVSGALIRAAAHCSELADRAAVAEEHDVRALQAGGPSAVAIARVARRLRQLA